MRTTTIVFHSLLALLLASCGGSSKNTGTEVPASETASDTDGVGESAEESMEDVEDLPPDACQQGGGECAESTCEERGTSEIIGTCYLGGEPQTNLNCCASS